MRKCKDLPLFETGRWCYLMSFHDDSLPAGLLCAAANLSQVLIKGHAA
jgi:hypothetical protein